MLLHQLEVNRIAGIFAAAKAEAAAAVSYPLSSSGLMVRTLWILRAWLGARAWVLVCACDHVLGGHGLGFPLLHHYQHLPHLAVGLVGALLQVRP
jgi:hypothetical protein